jgi:hypothetical protein
MAEHTQKVAEDVLAFGQSISTRSDLPPQIRHELSMKIYSFTSAIKLAGDKDFNAGQLSTMKAREDKA